MLRNGAEAEIDVRPERVVTERRSSLAALSVVDSRRRNAVVALGKINAVVVELKVEVLGGGLVVTSIVVVSTVVVAAADSVVVDNVVAEKGLVVIVGIVGVVGIAVEVGVSESRKTVLLSEPL